MISLVRAAWQEELRTPMFVGLSTDGFPAKEDPAMKNGARCYHMDTAKEYEYSAEDEQWYEVPQSGGGGGGGLPPVTGSGKALVSVNGRWTQQEGFPYDEGEITETKFDETFSGFTRGTDEDTNYLYPIENSDPENENNVAIGGVTYYYVDSNAYDYSSIGRCDVRDESWNHVEPYGLEFIQSGDVKKVTIPYSFEQYDPETGDPIDPLTGTLYGVFAPTDGAQDADGNIFPAAGFYCSVNGDLSGSYVGVEEIGLGYTYPSDYWTATVPLDSGVEFDSEKNYRVYINGETAEGAYADYTSISLDENENSYVVINDIYDGEGELIGYEAVCGLDVENYETAPASMEIKVDEVVSGVHPIDGKLLFGENVQDGTALVNVGGEMTKQDGYAYRTPEDYNEIYSADSTIIVSGVGTQIYNCSAAITDGDYDVGETIVHPTFYDYGADPDNAIGIYLHHWGNFTPEFSEQSGDVGVIRHDDEMWILVNNPSSTAGSDLNNCYFEYPGIYTNYSEGDPFFQFVIIGSGDYVACFSEYDNVYTHIRGIRINSSDILEVDDSDRYYFGDGSVIVRRDMLLTVLLSEEDSQYISDDSATVTLYSVEGGVVPFDSDYIPWDSMPSDAIDWDSAPEGTGLPEPTYEDGTYILQATESDGEMSYEWVQGSGSGTVITAENNTTINTYQVPQLTTEQIQAAYNAVAAGKSVTIIDATETMMFSGLNADVVSDEIFISFRYFDKMILEYDENGTINYTTILSATEVQNMINATIGNAIGGAY